MNIKKIPKIIGHRGAKGLAPENTLSSIKTAKSFGIDFVEVDVKISKDKIPILMHDNKIDRTTNGTGYCYNYNFTELLTFDAGSWFDKKYNNERILSLDRCLKYLNNNKMGINIELKPNKGKEKDNVNSIKKILKNSLIKNCFFSTFDYFSLKLVCENIPSIPRGILFDNHKNFSLPNIIDICNKYNCFSVGIDKKIINFEMIQLLKKNKLKVNVFTVNELEYAKNLIEWGIDSIFTDRPDIVYY